MNKDMQTKPVPKELEEKGKIVEIKNKDDVYQDEMIDKSMYGEFMSTYNYWLGTDAQRKRAHHLENITKHEKENTKQ